MSLEALDAAVGDYQRRPNGWTGHRSELRADWYGYLDELSAAEHDKTDLRASDPGGQRPRRARRLPGHGGRRSAG